MGVLGQGFLKRGTNLNRRWYKNQRGGLEDIHCQNSQVTEIYFPYHWNNEWYQVWLKTNKRQYCSLYTIINNIKHDIIIISSGNTLLLLKTISLGKSGIKRGGLVDRLSLTRFIKKGASGLYFKKGVLNLKRRGWSKKGRVETLSEIVDVLKEDFCLYGA